MNHYYPSIPGLFAHAVTLDELYKESEFLFWTVICIGARKYSKDPTMIERLSRHVTSLAQKCLFEPEQVVPKVQAVLLLCLWPLPLATTFKDPSHALAGAAMNLAIQNGLHYAGREQDFSRDKLKATEENRRFRAGLWLYCVVVFQRYE